MIPGGFRQEHEDNLRDCDGLIVYYGNGTELWERRKRSEIRKISGQGQ